MSKKSISEVKDLIQGKEDFCVAYAKFNANHQLVYLMFSLSINVINAVLGMVMIALAKQIKYHNESQVIRQQIISIFAAQYFNTAIILLLTNANFENTVFKFLPA